MGRHTWRHSIGLCLIMGAVTGCIPTPPLSPVTEQRLTNQNLDTFESYYDITITGSRISDKLVVNGDLIAQNNQFNNVSVNGHSRIVNSVIIGQLSANGATSLNNVAVKDNLNINGLLEAHDSVFEKNLEAFSGEIILDNVKLNNIYVRAVDNNTIIYLKNGSQVKGDIQFQSGAGRVLIDIHSKVHGSILGGESELELLDVNIG